MTTDPPRDPDRPPAVIEPDPLEGRLRVVFVAGGRWLGERTMPRSPSDPRPAPRPLWKAERAFVYAELRRLHEARPIDRLVHGDCRRKDLVPTGADKWAAVWCIHKGVWCYGCPAPFPALGSGAGPQRTALMFDDWHPYQACTLVAFPGGRGTERAIELAYERDMQVIDLRAKGPR